MNKNELLFEQARIQARKFELLVGLGAHLGTLAALVLCVWLVFEGLRPLVQGQSPEAIAAFANVVEALKLGFTAGYAWGAVATGAWWLERKGKKRAISEKSRYQKVVERDDPERSSSGLTETGETPEESRA